MSQLVTQRQKIDEYLDGTLDVQSQREMEASLAADSAAAKLLARVKSERALRAAAYESYAPTAQESSRFAAQVMAAAHQPVGRIGPWLQMRRLAGIAAAVAVLVGTFYVGHEAGRSSVNQVNVQEAATPKTVYRVVYVDSGGIQRERDDLASLDELNDYIKELNQNGVSSYAVADSIVPGRM
jgi:anti-sigma factor RsiW